VDVDTEEDEMSIAVGPRPQIRTPVGAVRGGRVTVGTDGSYWGGMALDWAARHAWLRGAELDVLRADEDQPADIPADLGISHAHRTYPLLRMSCQRTGPTPVVDLTTASAGSELLVLGCRGHRRIGLGELVIPTLMGAQCDVLVVRGTPDAVRGAHRTITAMVNGSATDSGVLRRGAEFAAAYRSRLRVVHTAPSELRPTSPPEDVLHMAELQLKTIRATFTLIRALPHEALLRDDATDLVVLGRGESRRHVDKPGPVTRTALYHAPCPVLVVRP
jgi:nucleotide-binding universal stress UspA family protein